jgi:alpha-tubulin suppressor-like RCC1 family protein
MVNILGGRCMARAIGLLLTLIIVFCVSLTPVQADGLQPSESIYNSPIDSLPLGMPSGISNGFDFQLPVNTSSNNNLNIVNSASLPNNNSNSASPVITGIPWTWGDNYYGQLGNGFINNGTSSPVQATGLNSAIAIATGPESSHSLALRSDGTVWAWGYNGTGELGNGTTKDSSIPVQVSGLNGVMAISAGSSHSLALKSNGTVWAWGSNSLGMLGNGSTNNSSIPVQVSGLSGVTAIAGGGLISLALKSDGTVWDWGHNGDGELGNGSTINSSVPVQVSGLNGVTAIAAGSLHCLALKSDGTVWTWGYNRYGELGNGTTTNSPTPLQVIGLSGITAIAGGGYHSLFLKSDGTVWACGYNTRGELGNGTTTNSPTPLQVIGLSGITAIAGGGYHSLALKSDGSIWAWGDNVSGELGTEITPNSAAPVHLSGLSGVTTITGGQYHSLFLKSEGTVWACGAKNYGQLGNGDIGGAVNPIQVTNISGAIALAAGAYHNLALRSDGNVWAWGYNWAGQLGDGSIYIKSIPVQVNGLSGITAIAAGGDHSQALKSDGSVWGWGDNEVGQVGVPTTKDSWRVPSPHQISSLNAVIAIAGGDSHSLALKSDGTVWAWGINDDGELGNGSTSNSSVPIQVTGLSGVMAITGGGYHSLALKSDGTVWAWGYNNYGQLGNGTTNSSSLPVQVSSLSSITAISAGYWHSLALKSDGTIWAWGYNGDGELGNGSTNNSSVPIQVTGLTGVMAITGGGYHSLALKSDRTVWDWGNNLNDQLGNGTANSSSVPVQVTTLSNTIKISAGLYHSLALVDSLPTAPTLTSPAEGTTVSGTSVTFQWAASSGATNYWLAVVKTNDNSIIVNKSVGNATSSTETGFSNDGTTYRWVVAAGNSAGWGSASTMKTFTNGTITIPAAPTLTSPADGANVSGTSVTFHWAASSGATNYWLAVIKASDNSVIINKSVGNVTSDTETGFPNNGTQYRWVVAAGNSTGWGSASTMRTFTNGTSITIPPAPTLTSPPDGATVSGTSVTFQWSASTGATKYWLALVKVSDNSVIINKEVGNVTSDAESGFPNDGSAYRWVVAAGNSAGWSAASASRAFTNGTAVTIPPSPNLTSPADGATVAGTSVTFHWAASTGATNYWLAVVKASDNSIVVNKAIGNVTSDTEAGFLNNGAQYRWVVAAGNSAGWGSASALRTFTNGSAVPPAPSLTAPADGAKVSGTLVTFQWSASSGATNYWIAVFKASDNSIIINKPVGSVTSDTETGFPNNDTSYVWVVAAGNSAGWSSASTARTFTNGP